MPISQHGSRVAFHRSTPLGLKLFGIAFAAIPSVMAVMMVWDVLHGGDTSLLLVALMPGVFLVIAAVLVFGRYGVSVDFDGSRIRRWKAVGPLSFGGWQSFEGSVSAVSLRYNERVVRTKNGSHTVREWPLTLEGSSDEGDLLAPRDYLDARTFAEALARAGHCDMVDTGMGEERRRSCDELDVPLSKRLQELPDLPAGELGEAEGLRIEDDGQRLTVHIKPPGMHPMVIIVPFAGLVFAGIVLLGFGSEIFGADTQIFFRIFMASFAVAPALVAIIMGLKFLRMSTKPEELRLDSEVLDWRQGGSHKTMRLEKLEELIIVDRADSTNSMVNQNGVAAVSDYQLLRIGSALDEAGRKRLFGALLQKLQQLGR